MRSCVAAVALLALAGSLASCGGDGGTRGPAPVLTPIGAGPRFQPAPGPRGARAGRSIAGLRCRSGDRRRYGVHVELFARRRVIVVPAGIGVARGCRYPLATVAPTGVVEVARDGAVPPTLGDLFAVWGRPLGPSRLLSFRAQRGERVAAFVGGRPWRGDPRAIPLGRHAQIVVEIGGNVAPHAHFVFAPGL